MVGWQWRLLDHEKSLAPHSRQITMPAPHHSIFYSRMLMLTPKQQCQSTEGKPTALQSFSDCQYVSHNDHTMWNVRLEHNSGGSRIDITNSHPNDLGLIAINLCMTHFWDCVITIDIQSKLLKCIRKGIIYYKDANT